MGTFSKREIKITMRLRICFEFSFYFALYGCFPSLVSFTICIMRTVQLNNATVEVEQIVTKLNIAVMKCE